MRNSKCLTVMMALGLAAPMVACDDGTTDMGTPISGAPATTGDGDTTPTTGDGDTTPTTGDGDGQTLHEMVDMSLWGDINVDCPEDIPFEGRGTPRGACCYRQAPNSEIVKLQPDSPLAVTEYRLNYQVTTNHPDSIGIPALVQLALNRGDRHEWNMLWRFEQPRSGGLPASGPGYFYVGWGGYNCDGTYSHYGPNAAPTDKVIFPGGDDAGRWEVRKIPITVDATKDDINRFTVPFEQKNVGNTYTPFLNADTFALEWELIAQGFTIDSITFAEDSLDCVGSRQGGEWKAGGVFRSYAVVNDNHYTENGIPTLGFQTFSQLVAFGLLSTEEDRMNLDPKDATTRCMPQLDTPAAERTCRWVKLPDSLCPTSPEELALYGCHVAWEANPDSTPTNCSQTAPTTPRSDPAGDEGQCCDPMGANGLPVCNAFVLFNEYVAAAAEIVDAPLNNVDTKCGG